MSIKKKILAALVLAVFVFPGVSFAQTQSVAQLQQIIAQLEAQIVQLQAQLQSQLHGGGGTSSTGTSGTSGSGGSGTCYTFDRNLFFGMRGSDVTDLQQALQKDGESVQVTGAFDSQTVAAVTSFQEKYSLQVLSSYHLSRGTGFVGASTRNELNVLFGCDNGGSEVGAGTSTTPGPLYPVDQALTITKLDPNPATVGATVTITGTDFSATSTVLMNGMTVADSVASLGNTLTFTVPPTIAPDCSHTEVCPQSIQVIGGGSYGVSVRSGGQTSNVIMLTVAGNQTPAQLKVTENTGLSGSSVVPGTPSQEIGAYVLAAPTAEGANVSSISIDAGPSAGGFFQNLRVFINGVQFGATQAVIQSNGVYVFSGTPIALPAGTSINITLIADILSTPQATTGSVLADATSFSACSAAGSMSYAAYGCNSVTGQTMTLGSQSAPTINVLLSANTPPAEQLAMGTTGNVLGSFVMANMDTAEAVDVNAITFLDTTNVAQGSKPAFSNIQVWNGGTLVGTAAAPTVNAANSGYSYTANLGNPLVIPAGGTVEVLLRGDLATFTSGAATDGSIHTFSVADVAGVGATSFINASANTANASANPITIYRTLVTVTAAPGSAVLPLKLQQIGAFTLTANAAGTAMPNAVTLTFGGSGVSAAFLQSVSLRDANGNVVASPVVDTTNNKITWQFQNSYPIVAGSSYVFTVWGDLGKVSSSANTATYITGTIRSGSDFSYYDGMSASPIMVNLPQSQVPITVASLLLPANVTPAPTLTAIAPASAAVGTSVTITGTGFGPTSTVLMGGLSAASGITSSPTSITFTVPSTLGPNCTGGMACPQFMQVTRPGQYNVTVVTNGQTSNGLTFTVTPGNPGPLYPVDQALTITKLDPNPATVGATVTITGTDFSATSTVLMNGIAVASNIPSTPTNLTFIVPNHFGIPCTGGSCPLVPVAPGMQYTVTVQSGGFTSNGLALTVTSTPATASNQTAIAEDSVQALLNELKALLQSL